MAFSEGKFLELIDQFYEAACSPGNWRDALQQAAGALGAEGVNLLTGPDCPLAPVCSPALEEMRCTGEKEGWWKDNPRLIRGMTAIHNPKDIITDATLFSKEELDRLPFHADFLARFELRWFAGMLLVPEGRTKVALSVDRRRDQDPFSSG